MGALAAAPLDDVLAAWAGLGYYSRARNLKKGAQAVAARFAGELPRRAAELREVPGIGPYTAGAIASIAFGERTPLVDGNVARVLARAYAIEHDIKSSAGQRELWARAGALVDALPDSLRPGDLNQGLMELGATVCSPTQPRCLVCPIARRLRGATGAASKRAIRSPRRASAPTSCRCSRAPRCGCSSATRSCSLAASRTVCSAGCGSCRRPRSRREISRALGVTANREPSHFTTRR